MQKHVFLLVCFTVLKILNEMTDTFTKKLVPSLPIRSCLSSPESFWQHLEASDSFWKHLEASGSVPAAAQGTPPRGQTSSELLV